MDEFWDNLWGELEGLLAAEKQILSTIGENSIELERAKRLQAHLQSTITNSMSQYDIIESAKNAAIEKIVKAADATDGDYEVDFVNRKVIKKNEQVSDSSDG